jgi:hypothetical protein
MFGKHREIGGALAMVVFIVATLTAGDASAGKKEAIDNGDGTFSIDVHAAFTPRGLGELRVVSADATTYCAIFRDASRRVWKLTNGQHFFGDVHFTYGATETDAFIERGTRSFAHGNRVLFQISFPNPAVQDVALYGNILAHEWGHYFYGLADEYSEPKDLGFCSDSRYFAPSDTCTGFPTSSCQSGARCIRHNACVNAVGGDVTQGGKYDGFILAASDTPPADVVASFGVVSENQCMAENGSGNHPVCALHDPSGSVSSPFGGPEHWPNWGKDCSEDKHCDSGPGTGEGRCTLVLMEAPGPPWNRDVCDGPTSCIMSDKHKEHWCDANTHVHLDGETGASLSHNQGVLATALDNYLNDEPGWFSAEDYNCWDQAILEWKHLSAGRPGDGGYDPDLGVPPNDGDPCTWDVPDSTAIEDLSDWSMIVIDASHSMEKDANGTDAWVYAVDGAEYFNQVAVDKGTKAGIYAFGDELWPVQWMPSINDVWVAPQPGAQEMVLGDPVDLEPENVALHADGVGDYVHELHVTNLCAALEGAAGAFETGGAPRGDREVVLLTDGRFSRRTVLVADDDMVTCRGVVEWIDQAPEIAKEICSEAGMRVNVISTGATPDFELAQWLADSCGGWHDYAGDDQAAGGSLPHAAKVYAAMAKAKVAGHVIALHERAPLAAPTTTESRTFSVAAGAKTLDVAWIGSPYANADVGTRAFDFLEFTLESPIGVFTSPAGNSSEIDALYRRVAIPSPEPGVWTMHIDKSQVSESTRAKVDVGWLASIDDPRYQADAWIEGSVRRPGDQVAILGHVTKGEYGVGGLAVAARISADGQSWDIPMFDDGQHGDGSSGDGVFGGLYAPTVVGPYAVKVDHDVVPNVSHTIPGESIFGTGPASEFLSDSASLIAHTSFEVRHGEAGVVHATLPQLQTGRTHWNLAATVEGVFVPTPGIAVSLGEGVTVFDLAVEDVDRAGLVYELRFNVDVAPDAPLTQRDLVVEIGTADHVEIGATSVVAG